MRNGIVVDMLCCIKILYIFDLETGLEDTSDEQFFIEIKKSTDMVGLSKMMEENYLEVVISLIEQSYAYTLCLTMLSVLVDNYSKHKEYRDKIDSIFMCLSPWEYNIIARIINTPCKQPHLEVMLIFLRLKLSITKHRYRTAHRIYLPRDEFLSTIDEKIGDNEEYEIIKNLCYNIVEQEDMYWNFEPIPMRIARHMYLQIEFWFEEYLVIKDMYLECSMYQLFDIKRFESYKMHLQLNSLIINKFIKIQWEIERKEIEQLQKKNRFKIKRFVKKCNTIKDIELEKRKILHKKEENLFFVLKRRFTMGNIKIIKDRHLYHKRNLVTSICNYDNDINVYNKQKYHILSNSFHLKQSNNIIDIISNCHYEKSLIIEKLWEDERKMIDNYIRLRWAIIYNIYHRQWIKLMQVYELEGKYRSIYLKIEEIIRGKIYDFYDSLPKRSRRKYYWQRGIVSSPKAYHRWE